MTTASPKFSRTIVFVDETMLVEGEGYRIPLVVEGENGHHPTGTWPYTGAVGETRPWFWGPTIEKAREACERYNERLGVSKEEAHAIVLASMFGRPRRRKK